MTAPDPATPNPLAAATTSGTPEPSIVRISARTAVILLLFTLAFTALMAGTYKLTQPMLEASAQAEKLRLIGEVLPPLSYDNPLLDDAITLPPTKAIGLDDDSRAYRARKDGKPVALVFEAAALDGYSGRIGLIVAVAADGRLLAMRVTQHKETPGLGDYVDPKKDKNKASPWIRQFDGVGFDTALGGKWKVKKDGGQFDQRAGATISARAVTNASGRALLWAQERSAQLFELPAGKTFEEKAK
ncbi:MAG: electron transport complex subunit RsxG [Gammaproteobacteria bacterium]|nr:electron transport complex subunit RsxG [Gammaproteobacteria bacterium]MBU1645804.1 electron transport complex subunit RsxG [Gammaproteobacteria bacterium]MBU1971312.1 electron transport complex subunit RsxG [Gammaproteobacteria bacterium]